MRDGRHRDAREGGDGPFHAFGREAEAARSLNQCVDGGAGESGADQLPETRERNPQSVMVSNIFQAGRSAIGCVALFEGNHGGSCPV